MQNIYSIKVRVLISAISNALRSVLSFAAGVLIARALDPSGYGDLMFLLGSFVAIRSLLDMGTSSAFFTFLSMKARDRRFYVIYFAWLLLQFILTFLLLWLVVPSNIFNKVWLGHEKHTVLLAFASTFMQQQVWQAVVQIGESMRKTVEVQLMNLGVVLTYFVSVLLVSIYGQLTIEKILTIMIVQYVLISIFARRRLKLDQLIISEDNFRFSEVIGEYWCYCKPMLAMVLVNFLHEFGDKWILQKFGGAEQQGYFQIANQFAAISLLATASIINIFWKEIAECWARQDLIRIAFIYKKVSRGLVLLGSVISGFLMPWSDLIVKFFLGPSYVDAWPVFSIMLLYPIHQSLGQIAGVMFLASSLTRKYMIISVVIALMSIPISYMLIAPTSVVWLPVLGMGALGMACKMVFMGIVSVNIQAWIVSRVGGWRFDWLFQVVGIPLILIGGFVAKYAAVTIVNPSNDELSQVIYVMLIFSFVYLMLLLLLIWLLPWLIGSSRDEVVLNLKVIIFRKTL